MVYVYRAYRNFGAGLKARGALPHARRATPRGPNAPHPTPRLAVFQRTESVSLAQAASTDAAASSAQRHAYGAIHQHQV